MENRRRRQVMPHYDSFELLLNGIPVMSAERAHFKRCVQQIAETGASFVFREEHQERIYRQYVAGFSKHDNYEFNQRIFIIGQKGRYFQKQIEYYQPAIRLASYSYSQFETLFRMLHYLMENTCTGLKPSSLKKFKEREPDVYSFFIDTYNLAIFLGEIDNLTPEEKAYVRDYYLGLLHNIDRSRFYSQSFLLSTSTRLKVEEGFAGIRKGHGYENAIILSG